MKALEIIHVTGGSHVVHGISRRDFPKFAENHHIISGGNGTYRVADPAVTTLAYEDDNGKVGYMDFNEEFKQITGKKNIHQSRVNEVNRAIRGMSLSSLMKDDLKSAFSKALELDKKKQKELQKMMKDTNMTSNLLKK